MKRTVLLLSGLLQKEIEMLEQNFKVVRLERNKAPEAVLETHAREIVGVISAPWSPVGPHLIDALPNLEIICQAGVGYDNIDLEYAGSRGIAVTNTPDLVTNDTADIAMALILSLLRRVVEADMFVRVGKWRRQPMGLGLSLAGKSVGILGMGRIGRAVAQRAEAFGMKVIYSSRTQKTDLSYKFFSSPEALATSADILVVCCSGGEETKGLVDGKVLKALGPSGFLVNVGRGTIVDEEDLQVALRNRSVAGAGMDVFTKEPEVPEAFFSMDNVVLLPHIGTATYETRSAMGRLVIDNLLAYFRGEPLKTPVAI